MNIVFRGIGIATFFSSLFALTAYITGGNVLQWFLVSFLIQFVVYPIVNMILKFIGQMKVNKLRVMRLNTIDKNSTDIKCAKCEHVNRIPIDIHGDNGFRCVNCGTENTVFVSLHNAQKTNILYSSDSLITEEKLKHELKNG